MKFISSLVLRNKLHYFTLIHLSSTEAGRADRLARLVIILDVMLCKINDSELGRLLWTVSFMNM